MENLNEQLRRRFGYFSPAMPFLRGFTYYYLLALSHRDMETNKQIFQLKLDTLGS